LRHGSEDLRRDRPRFEVESPPFQKLCGIRLLDWVDLGGRLGGVRRLGSGVGLGPASNHGRRLRR
jgi:hypothetical protein